jgi:hypothetical protein
MVLIRTIFLLLLFLKKSSLSSPYKYYYGELRELF